VNNENIWARGLRMIAFVFCVVGTVGAFYAAYQTASTVNSWTGETDVALLLFFIVLIPMIMGTFIVTAVIIVLLDMASDINETRQSNLAMLKILSMDVEWNACYSCGESYVGVPANCSECGAVLRKNKAPE